MGDKNCIKRVREKQHRRPFSSERPNICTKGLALGKRPHKVREGWQRRPRGVMPLFRPTLTWRKNRREDTAGPEQYTGGRGESTTPVRHRPVMRPRCGRAPWGRPSGSTIFHLLASLELQKTSLLHHVWHSTFHCRLDKKYCKENKSEQSVRWAEVCESTAHCSTWP